MEPDIEIRIKSQEIIEAVRKMKKEEREEFIEDLIESVSPDYLESIKQAREDYKAGRVKSTAEYFTT